MDERLEELGALQAAFAGRAQIQRWARGAELLALLQATSDTKTLDLLTRPITAEALATVSDITTDRARRIIEVLQAAGVVRKADDSSPAYVLSPEFGALHAGASGVELATVLEASNAALERVHSAFSPPTAYDWESDALVIARDWGVRPTAAARSMFVMAYDALPAYRDRLGAGGPLLDVGSGVGGAVLSALVEYPALRAVTVERASDVVEELRQRAQAAGVAARLDIRHSNAQELDDDAVYGVCYWAQAFFPSHTRESTLAAIRRALAPGGLLLAQELAAPADDSTSARLGASLDALVADCRGVPPVVSAEDLAAELRAGGFTGVEVVPTAVGRLVLGRRGQ
ncbi:SAM-dependent methyltransferase [Streptomyces mutabilis]|uniref:SAM-dependent methyltransferase n=1 Tax=Streptomyces mutabilis TaxID=67332 RepID=UPI0034286EF7